MQLILAFVGVSGSGKTTFLRSVAKKVNFQHLTAGSLIFQARNAQGGRDHLRLLDIDENQKMLIDGFTSVKDHQIPFIILDGHVVVDGPTGLFSINQDVFRKIGIGAIAHFEADPVQIAANRANDVVRNRPLRSPFELDVHQDCSRAAAVAVARALSVPVKSFTHSEEQQFLEFLMPFSIKY